LVELAAMLAVNALSLAIAAVDVLIAD